mgnify:CR=1 FL=1
METKLSAQKVEKEGYVVAVYFPRHIYRKLKEVKRIKGFNSNSSFLRYIIIKYLEEEGFLK